MADKSTAPLAGIKVIDWTQVQSIWENGTDNEENGHTAAQKCCQPVKVSAVRKEKVCTGYGEKYEP